MEFNAASITVMQSSIITHRSSVRAGVWLLKARIIQKAVTGACPAWVSSLRKCWQRHIQCSKGCYSLWSTFTWQVEWYFQCTADHYCLVGAGELKAPISLSSALSAAKRRDNKVSSHSNTNVSLFIAVYCCLQTAKKPSSTLSGMFPFEKEWKNKGYLQL